MTILQKNPDKIVSLEISFIQWIQNNTQILEELVKNFEDLRTELLKTKKYGTPDV